MSFYLGNGIPLRSSFMDMQPEWSHRSFAQKGSMFGSMLSCHCIKMFNNFLKNCSTFSFFPGPYKLFSQACIDGREMEVFYASKNFSYDPNGNGLFLIFTLPLWLERVLFPRNVASLLCGTWCSLRSSNSWKNLRSE